MSAYSDLAALVLCGGKGTRAYPHTAELPKPLLDVDGNPILRHVMDIYASQGFERFILAAGFRPDLVADFASRLPRQWKIDVVDTGEETDKGDRILRCREHLGDMFFVTYGDGVGDVCLKDLIDFHQSHPGSATVTVTPFPSQYGTLEFNVEGQVHAFREKPVLHEHWINAGFFLMETQVFEHWLGADLEGEVLPALGGAGELYAYRHNGFWRSMDTYKDAMDLTDLARSAALTHGRPPWIR